MHKKGSAGEFQSKDQYFLSFIDRTITNFIEVKKLVPILSKWTNIEVKRLKKVSQVDQEKFRDDMG